MTRYASIEELPEAHRGEAMRQMDDDGRLYATPVRVVTAPPPPVPPKKPSEHDEQVAVFRWAQMNEARWPELRWMFAIPNGGARATLTAIKLKAEGVKSGVPDIFLPEPRNDYSGLWIELKVGKNKATDNQNAWMAGLIECGYAVALCYGAEEAIQVITSYLRGEL